MTFEQSDTNSETLDVLTPRVLKEHLNNIIEALVALCPTRNYIAQFLKLLPEEYPVMYESFYGFLRDRETRQEFGTLLGLSYGANLEIRPGTLGEQLRTMMDTTLTLFTDETQLNAWNEFLAEVRKEPIPNIHKEWVLARVQMAIKEPTYGADSLTLLRLFCRQELFLNRKDQLRPTEFSFLTDEEAMTQATNLPQTRIIRITEFLMNKFSLICRDAPIKVNDQILKIWRFQEEVKIEWLKELEEFQDIIREHELAEDQRRWE